MPKTSDAVEGWQNKIHRLLFTYSDIHIFIKQIQQEQYETVVTNESIISNKVVKKKKKQ